MSTENSGDQPTFDQQVKATLEAVTVGEDGKTVWPEDVPEPVLFAARAEKRYRDTQSAFTKGQQKLKTLEEERTLLAKHIEEIATISLPEDEKQALEELKHQDPEAWRTKMNELETATKNKLSETMTNIGEQAKKKGELAAREDTLAQFREENPGLVLNDEVIENDIPPRITKKLADGQVSFEEFLNECKDYLSKGKVVGGVSTPPDDPNLSDIPGGSAPANSAVEGDIIQSYKSEVY